jgi:hypothetical protein
VIGARRRVASDALVIVGGGALVISAFMHWVSRGYGSGLRGHALIDAIVAVGRHFPGMSVAQLTVLWYLVPAFGASSWIVAGLRGAGSKAERVIAVLAAAATLASALAIVWLVGFSHLGPGAWVALAGAVALVVGAWIVAPARADAHPSVRMTGRGR